MTDSKRERDVMRVWSKGLFKKSINLLRFQKQKGVDKYCVRKWCILWQGIA